MLLPPGPLIVMRPNVRRELPDRGVVLLPASLRLAPHLCTIFHARLQTGKFLLSSPSSPIPTGVLSKEANEILVFRGLPRPAGNFKFWGGNSVCIRTRSVCVPLLLW